MEIIKRSDRGPAKFRVVKAIRWGLGFARPGEIIEGKGPEVDGLVQAGRIIPDDIPETSIYISLKPFFIPGRDSKFECKPLERVELTAKDGLEKMLEGSCIPEDESRWRPANRRLKVKGGKK